MATLYPKLNSYKEHQITSKTYTQSFSRKVGPALSEQISQVAKRIEQNGFSAELLLYC